MSFAVLACLVPPASTYAQQRPERHAAWQEDEAIDAYRRRQTLRTQVVLNGSFAVGFYAAAIVMANRRREAEQELRGTSLASELYTYNLSAVESMRRGPYIYASMGSVWMSASVAMAVVGWGERLPPPWVAAVSGLAGLGLVAWGVVDIVRGGPCDTPNEAERQSCATDLRTRDRGGALAISTLPLLTLPVTQLIARAIDSEWPTAGVAFSPNVNPLQRSFQLNATLRWM